jgi:hypothetical protein
VTGQVEVDMILGTSAYKQGLRPTAFRPEVDAGLGYHKGATPTPKVCRTYFLNVPAAKAVVAHIRAARERAGTLTGVAIGEDTTEPTRDVPGDVLAVFGDDSGHMVLIIAAAVAMLGAAGMAGLLAFRVRRRLEDAARAGPPDLGAVSPLHRTARAARPLLEPRPAIEAPRQVHIHLHGVTPEDVAELVRRHSRQE